MMEMDWSIEVARDISNVGHFTHRTVQSINCLHVNIRTRVLEAKYFCNLIFVLGWGGGWNWTPWGGGGGASSAPLVLYNLYYFSL